MSYKLDGFKSAEVLSRECVIGDGKEVLCTARKRNTSAIPGLKHCPGALPTQRLGRFSLTHTPAENGRQAERVVLF